ncbi:tyrosine-protein phosphatase siw14 [Friedmanniomyces endolithicus]|uniref:Tyrosine-protein phosphatase siw14 n=1 Tax=Friedmanniomyces endolithicus TaxID=329885 RepID=A0AAN6FVB0_9PEZI|nr:tyrosine-protein phosphatase siw14 [Friedmanniomyces endolithicus]KAK0313622.1 tyrosine-protein phosphatase siw14 [Friedmanniomyces endolithicus]KAK0323917.1 tyrosine-protein phosphatase siw14 [Friedmanniomyces endolithicus]KAK0830413.1 tyrosine-protein phosphatase siw14 [Friedmanniomyces endolithicus]KAK0926497.1 tyrosine-protein phosphatase siw14 [Friedmanniomyces endolithicus]
MGFQPESYVGAKLSAADVVHIAGAEEWDQDVKGSGHVITMAPQQFEESSIHIENAPQCYAQGELEVGDMMVLVESKSRPPSPPESGAATPSLRITMCPYRLRPLVPPPNYGAVQEGELYRSAYPQDRNLDFLKLLGIRSVLCLVDTEPSEAYSHWISSQAITRHRVDIAPNKDGKVKTTWDSLCEALLIVLDSARYPLLIHCNQGKHRTGCIIACLRKIQHWPIDDIIAEYQAYANPKVRPGDIDLIRAFDPEAVFEYAKRQGRLDDRPFMRRADSVIANIDALADALAGKPPYCDDIDVSMASNASTFSDDSFETTLPIHNAPPLTTTTTTMTSQGVSQRPGLQRSHSQLRASGSSIAEETGVLDPALHDAHEDGATASVVELFDDVLSPPLEGTTMKMLGAA